MIANTPYALLIGKLNLRNWFLARTHLISASHTATVGAVLDEQIAVFIGQLGGMAGDW
ncbi:hypothetical protein [Glaciimonas sp. PCH181]|uniref:hypothetical protein n=1 Tax=Glaciimonas sp. PCH181 TaxID=2133943 RepID=UPI0013750A0A|nr:hypothetical protein [Glaciimonas sp. PCH181]